MKATKNLLLVIGSMALSASFFGIVNGDTFMEHFLNIVCGSSLIFGYFQFNKLNGTEGKC